MMPRTVTMRGRRTPFSDRFAPLTTSQKGGLLTFLVLSALDIAVSGHLLFGGGGAIVEANPVLAWSTGGVLLFLVTAPCLKAIGAGLLALLVSLVNRRSTLCGELVVLTAVGTTAALFAVELAAVGIAPDASLRGLVPL